MAIGKNRSLTNFGTVRCGKLLEAAGGESGRTNDRACRIGNILVMLEAFNGPHKMVQYVIPVIFPGLP